MHPSRTHLQVKNFRREVLSAAIEPAAVACPGMSVVALRIKGTAFLWHQVRSDDLCHLICVQAGCVHGRRKRPTITVPNKQVNHQ
jgi:tRNA U38,U39,U40 pseudouridine synthase TruA